MRSFRDLLFAGCVALLPVDARAVDASAAAAPQATATPAAQQEPEQGAPLDPTTAAALERLARSLAADRLEAAAAHTRGDVETSKRLDAEVRTQSMQFAALASRVDVDEFESPEQARKIDL